MITLRELTAGPRALLDKFNAVVRYCRGLQEMGLDVRPGRKMKFGVTLPPPGVQGRMLYDTGSDWIYLEPPPQNCILAYDAVLDERTTDFAGAKRPKWIAVIFACTTGTGTGTGSGTGSGSASGTGTGTGA